MDTKANIGLCRAIFFTIAALTYAIIFCLQFPAYPLHFHKDGVVHTIYINNPTYNDKVKYFGASFFLIPGLSFHNPSSFGLEQFSLYKQLAVYKFRPKHCYSCEHKCRDDLLRKALISRLISTPFIKRYESSSS